MAAAPSCQDTGNRATAMAAGSSTAVTSGVSRVDHKADQFWPGRGDRLPCRRGVVGAEPVQPNIGQLIRHVMLGVVEHRETQVETDSRGGGVDHPSGRRRGGEPAQPPQRPVRRIG